MLDLRHALQVEFLRNITLYIHLKKCYSHEIWSFDDIITVKYDFILLNSSQIFTLSII